MSSKGKGKARASSSQGDSKQSKKPRTSDAGEAGNVQSSMSKADRQKYVSDLVRFVLFASNDGSTIRGSGTDNKKGIKEVLGLAAGNSIEIVELANKTLEKVFGMKLVQLPEEDKKGKQPKKLWKDSMIDSEEEEGEATNGRRRKTAVSNDAQFVLTNILPAEQRLHLTFCKNTGDDPSNDNLLLYSNPSYYGLLMSLLALIYVKDMEITQKELQNFLDKMHLGKEETHEDFVDGDSIIKRFMAHRYLFRKGEAPGYVYRWGSRAHAEIKEAAVVRFIAHVFGEDALEWASQIDHNIADL